MPNVTITGTTVASSVPAYSFGGSNITLFNLGSIESTGAFAVLSTLASNAVVNSGTIGSGNTQRTGIRMTAGGAVTNQAGGTIRSGVAVQISGAAGTVANAGVITSTNASLFGVRLQNGGTISNLSGGTISGPQAGVYLASGSSAVVTNAAGGTITGRRGIFNVANAQVVNAGRMIGTTAAGGAGAYMLAGSITNQAGGTISADWGVLLRDSAGGLDNAGVILGQAGGTKGIGVAAYVATTVTNRTAGTISGASTGAVFQFGGTIVNQAGATIAGGTRGAFLTSGVVDNAGRIVGGNTGIGNGVTGALTVTNQSTGTISGSQFGVAMSGGGSVVNKAGGTIVGSYAVLGAIVSVDNAGLITAQSFAVRLQTGGSVTNRATGTITGTSRGVLMDVAGSVDNQGSIVGNHAVRMFGGGTLTNHAGAVISGGFDAIDVTNGVGTVINAGGIDALNLGVLFTTDGTVVNQATGTITGRYGVAMGILATGVTLAVENAGLIAGDTASGVGVFNAQGTVANLAGGTISGAHAIHARYDGAIIDNAGLIAGGAGIATYVGMSDSTAAGIWLPGGGSITNRAGGTITGEAGIAATGSAPATIANAGLIAGGTVTASSPANPQAGHGVFLGAGTLTNQVGGVITGRQAVGASGASATVVNAGSIAGTVQGATLANGALLTNQSGGVVSGGTAGVVLGSGGRLTNLAGGTITGGIGLSGVGTASTAGRIIGTSGSAVAMEAGSANRLIITRGATFTGTVNGGNTLGSSVVSTLELTSSASAGILTGLGTTITGFERIEVSAGATWAMTGAFKGTVVNHGAIARTNATALVFGAGHANRLVIEEGASFVGTINGGNAAKSSVQSTIELTSFSTTGTLTGLGTQFINFGRVEVDAGARWVLPAGVTGTVSNAGTIIGNAGTALAMGSGIANRVIVRDGAVFDGVVKGGNTIGSSIVSTLELGGTGTTTGLTAQFHDFAAIEIGTGADWTLTGAYTLAAGRTMTNAGSLTVLGGLTNAGTIRNGFTVNSGGSVTNTATGSITGGFAVDARYGAGVSVTNAGRITADPTAVGVFLGDNGFVTNAATGTISGLRGVFALGADTTVDNSGRIIATVTAGSRGVSFNDGGTVTNRASGTISGDLGVMLLGGGTLDNAGRIIGSSGTAAVFTAGVENRVVLRPRASFTGVVDGGNAIGDTVVSTLQLAAGTVTGTLSGLGSQFVNFGQVDVDAGASWVFSATSVVEGGLANAGSIRSSVRLATEARVTNQATGLIIGPIALDASEGAVTIANAGRLVGNATTGNGVRLSGGGTVTNSAGGTISGRTAIYASPLGSATIVNAGRLQGNALGGWGVDLKEGGTITNQAGGTITGYYGVNAGYLASTLTNAGGIRGSDAGGIGVGFKTGGTITNQAGGTIRAKQAIYGGASGPLAVVNAGTLTGGVANGVGVRLKGGGTITNQAGGTITGYNGIYASGSPATIVNSGGIRGSGAAAFGAYLSAGASVTNNAGGTIRGGIGVAIGGDAGTVRNAGTIIGSLGTAVSVAQGFANRVIVDQTGTFSGLVDGGNTIGSTIASTLQLAAGAGTGTLTGLGTQFVNFAQVTIDEGASWAVKATSAVLAGTTITGSGGTNALTVTTAGNFALGNVSGIPTIQLAAGANTVTLSDTTLSDGPVTLKAGPTGGNTIDASGLTAASAGLDLTYISGSGADTFIGGAADDTIFAGTGSSNMTGGDGFDRMVFISASLPTQTFSDFLSGEDSLLLYGINAEGGFDLGAVNNAMNPSSPTAIDPSIFVANVTGSFTSGDQRLAYNSASGSLAYSATGSNAGALVLATLNGAPTLTASDILFER